MYNILKNHSIDLLPAVMHALHLRARNSNIADNNGNPGNYNHIGFNDVLVD